MNNPLSPGAAVHYVERTDTTMAEARRFVETAGDSDGLSGKSLSGSVVCAGSQSAGRGRTAGRKWETPPGEALLFTVIFSKNDLARRMAGRPFTLLPLLCGLAAAEAVEEYIAGLSGGVESGIRIKWPNDIIAGGRKLCGILCEASGDYLYAGIGINLNQTSFPDGLRRPAVSIRVLTGSPLPPDTDFPGSALLSLFLQSLGPALGNNGWREAVEKRLYRIGEQVSIRPGIPEDLAAGAPVQEIRGRLAGLSESGAVLVDAGGRLQPFMSGELKV